MTFEQWLLMILTLNVLIGWYLAFWFYARLKVFRLILQAIGNLSGITTDRVVKEAKRVRKGEK